MEGIGHRTVAVNGINMHIAEKGQGPVVLFLHGFPELWYSWRHQIVSLAASGYHAVAPDLRGYGDTDAPPSISSYTCFHIVGDLIALIDTLGVQEVFLVGHDWGAMVAWFLAMFRPDKVRALVTLSVPFFGRNGQFKPVELFHSVYGDDYYISRFQEPGVIEAEMAASGTTRVITKFLTSIDPGPLLIPKGWFGDSNSPPITLPSWLSQEDVDYFASKFDKKGFTGPVNYYRNLDLNWELMSPWVAAQVKVPAKFVIGERDLVYNIQFMKEYIHSDAFKKDVPLLEEVVVVAGAGHFINQEIPSEVSAHIFKFFQKF
ncbi:hypothetical protein Sjap_011476 [Stephania japonica]|uniref:soluble epoxide hydrolase n=1 Tax=Stephania japonica TaxID=461633 RepID=A0AAP0P5K8_9MAGN